MERCNISYEDIIELGSNDEVAFNNKPIDEEFPLPNGLEYAYCLTCTTGMHFHVANMVRKLYPCTAFTPTVRNKQYAGYKQYEFVRSTLMPGYVFMFTKMRVDSFLPFREIDGFIKPLEYGVGEYRLSDNDMAIAKWLVHYEGELKESRVYRIGSKITPLTGPLKDRLCRIVEVNTRRQRAKVELDFNGNVFSAWLDFDVIEEKS